MLIQYETNNEFLLKHEGNSSNLSHEIPWGHKYPMCSNRRNELLRRIN